MTQDTAIERVRALLAQYEHVESISAPVRLDDLRALLAQLEAAQEARNEAVRLMSEASREAGDWKGRFEASELCGVVEGWRERALAAEAGAVDLKEELHATDAIITALSPLLSEVEGVLESLEQIYALNVPLAPQPDHPDDAYAAYYIPDTALHWGTFRQAAALLAKLKGIRG